MIAVAGAAGLIRVALGALVLTTRDPHALRSAVVLAAIMLVAWLPLGVGQIQMLMAAWPLEDGYVVFGVAAGPIEYLLLAIVTAVVARARRQ